MNSDGVQPRSQAALSAEESPSTKQELGFSPRTSATSPHPFLLSSFHPTTTLQKSSSQALLLPREKFNLRDHFLKRPLPVWINNELLKSTALIRIVSP